MAKISRILLALIVGSMLTFDSVTSAHLSKRQIGFTGGFSPADVNDATVKQMADFATSAIAQNTNSGPVKLVKLIKAETQVVAGTNYKLNLELVGTGANPESRFCEAVIFEQPWTNTIKLIRSSCAPLPSSDRKVSRRQIPVPGGFFKVDVNDPRLKEMANFAIVALSRKFNDGPVQLIEIVDAESQVVAGQNYEMTLRVSDGANGTPYTCKVRVFDQAWTNTRELSKFDCPSKVTASQQATITQV